MSFIKRAISRVVAMPTLGEGATMLAHTLFLGFIIMSLSSLAIFVKGAKTPPIRDHTYIHAAVPFIAATAYLAMTLGLGNVVNADGVITLTARYADWTFTTPLLLVGLVMTATHGRKDAAGFMIAIVTLDVLMIVAGLLSSLSAFPLVRIIWFAWSSVAFLGVLYILWFPLRRESRDSVFGPAYTSNLLFLTIIWFLYPVVFAIGPEGIRAIDTGASVWAILVLDVIAKVVYAFVAGASLEKAYNQFLAGQRRA